MKAGDMKAKPSLIIFLIVVLMALAGCSGDTTAPDPTSGDEETSPVAEGYTLFAPLASKVTYLMDNEGLTINEWNSAYNPGNSVYLLESGNLLRTAKTQSTIFEAGGAGGRVEELTWDGEMVWEFEYDGSDHRAHHDIERLPGGNILMIAWELVSETEAISAGRNPSRVSEEGFWPDHLIEVDSTGQIVWQWHVWDHLIQDLDSDKPNYGDVSAHPELIDLNFDDSGNRWSADWNHINSVDYDPELDQILLSVHGFGEIWIIDHSTTTVEAASHTGGVSGIGGDLLYRWGNPEAYGAGAEEDQRLFGQHDAQWIDAGLPGQGNVLIFNNGVSRPAGNYSSVEEIALPEDGSGNYFREVGVAFGPDSVEWIYSAETPSDFYADHISGAQRLPNGNTLICSGVDGHFFEVTSASEIVWEYVNPIAGALGNAVFRAERYPTDYPGFVNVDLTPGDPVGE